MMKCSKQTMISIGVPVVVAALAFWGGMAYGKQHPAPGARGNSYALNGMSNGQRGSFSGGQFGGQQGGTTRSSFGGVAAGTILSKDATSITVQLANGGSRIVLFGASTPVLKSTAGTAADLTVGQTVLATGTANQDGSITAQSISLGTAGMFSGFGGMMRTGAPTGTAPTGR